MDYFFLKIRAATFSSNFATLTTFPRKPHSSYYSHQTLEKIEKTHDRTDKCEFIVL